MLYYGISRYYGRKSAAEYEAPVTDLECVQAQGIRWRIEPEIRRSQDGSVTLWSGHVIFTPQSADAPSSCVYLKFGLEQFTDEDYLLMPAAVYNGNRYTALNKAYPPMFHQEDGIGPDMEPLITDVPRLTPGQDSVIHLGSGDMATPAFGVYQKDAGRGILLYGPPDSTAGYTGYRFATTTNHASMRIEAPCVRPVRYSMVNTHAPSDDTAYDFPKGISFTLPFRLYSFPCHSVGELFAMFMKTRSCMAQPAAPLYGLSFSQAFDIIEAKYKASQWNAERGYWRVSPQGEDKPYGDWQAGWVGGGISAYALACDGDEISRQRSRITMDTLFSLLQSPGGFIYPMMWEGEWLGDDFDNQKDRAFLLVRKNADILHFACKAVLLWQEREGKAPENWIAGIRRLADAFVRLYTRYGQIGQFINLETETILAGGTAGPAIAVGGLALAYLLTKHAAYRDTAEALAHQYYERHVRIGLLNGGPGEILQNPDSESAFGLLEGLMMLYAVTSDPQWLPMAAECANQAASWCMTYDYPFPAGSEFARLGMRTTGSVFANIQNKHSAPGICTLSPLSLLLLYRAVGDPLYLELAREIAHSITQYLSTNQRTIYSHSGEALPSGWMCERVNTSDWEGKDWVGAVYRGSCWCEISTMLTFNELPGFVIVKDEKRAIIFDHVEVTVSETTAGLEALCKNPTGQPLRVKYEIWDTLRFPTPELAVKEHGRFMPLLPGEEKRLHIGNAHPAA